VNGIVLLKENLAAFDEVVASRLKQHKGTK